MRNTFILLILSLVLFVSCNDSDDNEFVGSKCDQIAIIDHIKYINKESAVLSMERVEINGDCLEVVVGSGGCGGQTWVVELVDANRIAESNPEQRDLRILLKNEELCNAFILKTYSFDLRPIRITNSNKVLLNLEFWDEQILYEY
ncbi:hypothetical protein [Aquimarina algiphila]|uniref:Uncharacterized protein n=1 Tax=Aquimarina algiphila TaxID=2047982 RepID=A0A554VNE4_9FLAO|nr:hypothetical protein [Aquimarina algiphila]TSE09878.1 hypothetical protein FOF46_07635 [Aquimarina algiphila]